MLTSIYIDNFKSLIDFHLPPKGDPSPLPKMISLVGLNGAGKTSLIQALSFLRQLTLGRVSDWLDARDWRANDLKWSGDSAAAPVKRGSMTFSLGFSFPDVGDVTWSGTLNYQTLKCSHERWTSNGQQLLMSSPDLPFLVNTGQDSTWRHPASLKYEGSILSLFNLEPKDKSFYTLKHFWMALRSLELLSPHAMRRRARVSDEAGASGEKLSGFVARLSASDVEAMTADLQRFYPGVQSFSTRAVKAGWRELFVQEPHRQTSARHLNDGMLRVLAVISQIRSPAPCVILEEIENGISTEMLGDLTAYLADAPQQVIFTTHSVLLLNYLRDEDARASVFFLYKTPAGVTKAARLFSIPRMQEKLMSMGPGEAFADTDLYHLVQELNQEPPPATTPPSAQERPQ